MSSTPCPLTPIAPQDEPCVHQDSVYEIELTSNVGDTKIEDADTDASEYVVGRTQPPTIANATSQALDPAPTPTVPVWLYRAEFDPELGIVFRPRCLLSLAGAFSPPAPYIRLADASQRSAHAQSAPPSPGLSGDPEEAEPKKAPTEALLEGARVGREAKADLTKMRYEHWATLFEKWHSQHPTWSREHAAEMAAAEYLDDPPIKHRYKKTTLSSRTIVAAAKKHGKW